MHNYTIVGTCLMIAGIFIIYASLKSWAFLRSRPICENKDDRKWLLDSHCIAFGAGIFIACAGIIIVIDTAIS